MHERRIPALIPFLAFAAALIVEPFLVSPRLTIGAAIAASVLAACSKRTRAATPPALAFAIALAAGHAAAQHRATELRAVDALPRDRFATVTAPIDDDWRPTVTGQWRLRTASFRIALDGETREIDQPLALYLDEAPPPVGRHAFVHVEGTVRKSSAGRMFVSVKSPRLLSYSGAVSAWHPRWWNRVLDARLRSVAATDPDLEEAGALARALALGRSDELTDETRDAYRRGGTYHLLVFSGMQIAAAAAAIAALMRVFNRPRIADWALALLAAVAPAFAGDEPSVARASWMIGVFAASRIIHRPTPAANLLFVSAMIRLAVHPEEITHAGFALTYGATAGLVLIGPRLAHLAGAKRAWARAVAYSAGAEIGTTSLTILFFQQYVIGGSLVTLAVAPLLTAMLALSAGAAAGALANPDVTLALLHAIAFLDRAAGAANAFVGDVARLHGYAPAPAAVAVVGAWGVALAVLATGRRWATVVAIGALLVPAFVSAATLHARAEVPHPTVEFLDVGQGDATLVRNGRAAFLVDGGGSLRDPRFGSRVLIPALVARGVRRLDAVVLTHPHPDHCIGLVPVMQSLDVGELWVAGRHAREQCTARLLDIAFLRGIPVRIAEHQQPIAIAGLPVDPLVPRLRFKKAFLNNTSIVLRVRFGGRSVLLTGDIERDAERTLVDDAGPRLRGDVLKVAHHGSRTSTTDGFLDAVRPTTAVISCGANNPFGHPAATVLEALAARRIHVFRTDRDGSVHFTFGEGETIRRTSN